MSSAQPIPPIDPQALRSLRDFQLSFLRGWLASEPAREAWMAQGVAAIERMRSIPIGRLLQRDTLTRALDVLLDRQTARAAARPLAQWLADEGARHMPRFDVSLAELLGIEASGALGALIEHPDAVDEKLLRTIAQDPAMEAVMRDVLFDALVAFNERTNPFVAPWGVPALLDALPRIGRAAVRKTFDKVRGEFERRLEPEMRRFLETFARKSLDQTIDIFVDKAADPELVALRRHCVASAAAVPLSRYTWPRDDPRQALFRTLVGAGAEHALTHPRVRALLEAALDDAWARYASLTLGEWLDEIGMQLPDPEPFVAAAWPAVQAALSDDAVMALAADLIDASHEAWLASQQA